VSFDSKMAPESFVNLCQQTNYSCRAGYYQCLSENSDMSWIVVTSVNVDRRLAHYPESLSIK
jgi:hypothetical protein